MKMDAGKTRFILLFCIFAAIVLSQASCTTQAPVAKAYPYSEQYKMQAAHHWDLLDKDVVDDICLANHEKPIYVVPLRKSQTTPFSTAFHNFLTTQAVDAGYGITTSPIGAMKMSYDIQVVEQSDNRFIRPGRGWILATVGVGTYVIQNTAQTGRVWWPWALGGALVAEEVVGSWTVNPTDFELIVTTSILDGDMYVMRHTDVFYIDEPAWNNNYVKRGSTMEVVNQ